MTTTTYPSTAAAVEAHAAACREAISRGEPRPSYAGPSLIAADLHSAVLRAADLRGAVLLRASLYGAVLRDAVLQGAVLLDADLRGADLRGQDVRDILSAQGCKI